MKTTAKIAGPILFALGLAVSGCQKQSSHSVWQSINDPAITNQLKSFISEKQAQADSAKAEVLPGFDSFMAAAQRGDYVAVTHGGVDMENHQSSSDLRFHGTKMQIVKEMIGTYDAFGDGDAKYSALYGNEIIQSIPPGSIYFGGTDPGRFIITAMQKSQVNGDPFFTLTQNALADGTYLDYLRAMYGDKIYVPTAEDSQKCFDDYYEDVQQRMKLGTLQPGENVFVDPTTGKMQVSGQVSVMMINGLIAKVIFDKETNREFYLEESFPLAWMYPYLEPHGIIFKLNHQPLAQLSDDIVNQDHDYWSKTISPMIGDWLQEDTSVADIAAFNEKVFLNHDFSGFSGDTNFILTGYAHRMYSKERSADGGLYAWRAGHTKDASEKKRMNHAADFAFRQAWALCPYSPEAVFRYVQLLMEDQRSADALLVAETAAKFPGIDRRPNDAVKDLVKVLRQNRYR
jgi:hypothetical protein